MEKFDFDQVITHSTVFHADDVFGVALCRLINPKINIVRTLDVDAALEMANAIGKKALVFDIGLGKYDHHQENKALRDDRDNTPYCGFGLLWRDFGYLLCPDYNAWSKVDNTLVIGIDRADNGIRQNLLSTSISVMNPQWNDYTSENVAFHRAMNVAMVVLKAHVDHANAAIAAGEEVAASYSGGGILVLNRYLPYADTIIGNERFKDVLFVIFPSMRGGWCVKTVPKIAGSFENRMGFPKEWLGHADPERGITFAHTANFLITCETKDQAIRVAEEAIQNGSSEYTLAYSV